MNFWSALQSYYKLLLLSLSSIASILYFIACELLNVSVLFGKVTFNFFFNLELDLYF